MSSFPQQYKVVKLNQSAANAVACDVVCCKNAHKVWFIVSHNGTNDTDLVLALYEATDVAAGTNAAITKACPAWLDIDAGTSSDTLVKQTDGYSWTIDPALEGTTLLIVEWDPAKHTDGYDCVYLADTNGNASNTVTILAVIEPRYTGEQPPTVITD